MKTTPDGTKLILEEYLSLKDSLVSSEDFDIYNISRMTEIERTVVDLLGPNISVLLKGSVITTNFSKELNYRWLSVTERVGLDSSDKAINIECPLDNIDPPPEEDLIFERIEQKEEKPVKKKDSKVKRWKEVKQKD
jgi:hypothetical protein